MSPGPRRRLADALGRALEAMLPPDLRHWGTAVRCELATIADDGQALRFACDSLRGLAPLILAHGLRRLWSMFTGAPQHAPTGERAMLGFGDVSRQQRMIGIVCGIAAVGFGLAYLTMSGAPARHLAINAGALAVGLVLFALTLRLPLSSPRASGLMTVVMALALLGTALFGKDVNGTARWIAAGGLFIQTSFVLLPAIVIAFARSPNPLSLAAVAISAAALAIQPDRAMAGILLTGLMALAFFRTNRFVTLALLASFTGFAVTLARTDTLSAQPFVDQILYSAFDVHPIAGAAVLSGSALIVLPAVVGLWRDADNRALHAVFAAVWLSAISAAALGNYPTPIVGYGGSAILGYFLGLAILHRSMRQPSAATGLDDAPVRDFAGADFQHGMQLA